MGEGRPLTELERETWAEYERTIDAIPNARMYDRVSIHDAFPEVKAAFNKFCALSTYYGLTKDYEEN